MVIQLVMLTLLYVFLFSLTVSLDACLIRSGNRQLLVLGCCTCLLLVSWCVAPLRPSLSSSSSVLTVLLFTSKSRSTQSVEQSMEYSMFSTHGGSSSSKQLEEKRREEEDYIGVLFKTMCVFMWSTLINVLKRTITLYYLGPLFFKFQLIIFYNLLLFSS